MTVRRMTAAVSAVAVALAVAGCSGGEVAGTPLPSTDSSSSAGAGSDIPQVDVPLDASKYVDSPCALVPQETLAQLGYTEPGEPDTTRETKIVSGPGCGWNVRGGGRLLHVGLQTGNQQAGAGGLAAVRAAYESGRHVYYEPIEIDGYPAVFSSISDRRTNGDCRLWVGISNDLTFSVVPSGYENEQDSCGTAKTVASAVLTNLQGA